MTFIDWLRKLGILRFGAEAAVYHDATERPLSFQEKGVFNSEKDVFYVGKKPSAAQATADVETHVS